MALGWRLYREIGTFTPFQPCWIGDAPFSHDGVGTGFIPALTPIRQIRRTKMHFWAECFNPNVLCQLFNPDRGLRTGVLSFDLEALDRWYGVNSEKQNALSTDPHRISGPAS